MEVGHQLAPPRHAPRSASSSMSRGGWWCSAAGRGPGISASPDQPAQPQSRRRPSPCQALTFWPSSVISRTPRVASRRASATTAPPAAKLPRRAYRARRRRCRTCRSLPARSGRRDGPCRRRAAGVELATHRQVGVERPLAPSPWRPARAGGDRSGARHDVDGRRPAHMISSPSAWATQPATAIIGCVLRPRASGGAADRYPNRPSPPPSRGCGRC
jgi:hypothetical protein